MYLPHSSMIRMWWLNVKTGRPSDQYTSLFHRPFPLQLLLCGCVCALYVYAEFWWQPASHCPIIPAPRTLFILWGFLPGREREKIECKDEGMWKNKERRKGAVEKLEKSHLCVWVRVLMQWSCSKFPVGSSLSAVHCAGKGVSLKCLGIHDFDFFFLPLKHAWQHFQRWNFTFLYNLFQIVPNFFTSLWEEICYTCKWPCKCEMANGGESTIICCLQKQVADFLNMHIGTFSVYTSRFG